ncbi:hypothetical protein LK09_13690 [Microbacterium mangrovi]|uniref:GGDEF domain-containing protein n=1 Tax=Microbacterium mangrovi TaxID=1348253 RepID=A0A0B2A0F9_9MICO|nr:hypothetical protein LK09_13690 [Microbacterium mangrovi]
MSLMTAVVVIVSGTFFIVETMLRRDEGAGRVWSVAFLSAMLTTLAYMVWAVDPTVMWPVAVGNTTFVVGTGCMWLGCRVFNGRRMTIATLTVAVGGIGALLTVLLAGPDAGDWAGAPWMFACILLFAALGCVESVRGDMGTYRTSWGLCAVLGLQAVFYLGRIVVVIAEGFDSTLFNTWFGSAMTSVLTVILTIVALVVTSVLRADRAGQRGPARLESSAPLGTDDVLPIASFTVLLTRAAERAATRAEELAVLAVRMDDLPQISSAFGGEAAREISEAARASVKRSTSALALIAQDGTNGLLVAMSAASEPDARRLAGIVYRGLLDDLAEVGAGVIPVIGIGVVLTGTADAQPASGDAAASPCAGAAQLIAGARESARRAAGEAGSAVLVGGADLSAR